MNDFLKRHLKELLGGLITILFIGHFVLNFNLIQDTTLIGKSWMNLINGYILIIGMLSGLILLIWVLFIITDETAKDLEKFLLRKLTTACFLLILMLGFHGITGNLEKNFTLTAIGAIIVFWYGYKTYERDKEILMIEKFGKGEFTIEQFDEDLSKLAHAFYLYEKGYLPEHIWKRIDIRNEKLIYTYLERKLVGKTTPDQLRESFIDISEVLSKLKYEGGVLDYFILKMKDLNETIDKGADFSEIDKKEMEEISELIPKLSRNLNNNK